VFNRALQAHRQPGSAFKPFVYLAALEAGISPWDWRDDRAVDIAGYQPANYKDAHYGRLRLIDALARSVNTITVSLAQEVGIARVAAAARRMGITSPLQNYASLALGTNEVTPMELTAAYGGLARGETVKPYLVSRIETMDGKVLFERKADFGQPVIADTVRRDLTAMLFHVVTSGTGTAARLPDREAAGKTGTTQDYRDAWFVGFTSDYVASVWVGNDDNRPMRKVTGGLVPAQLWKDVMRVAETGLPPRPLDRSLEPAGITDDFAAEQVAYVDEVDAAAPQIPMDEQGSVLAGSGVSPDHLARNDYAPVAPPRAPVMPVSAPVPQQTDMPWQAEVEQTAPQRNYPPRPPEQPQAHDTSHPADDAYYGALPDQLRQAQMRQEQMSQAQMRDQQMRPEIRQESRQEQPPYYRPWQPVRPTPYQTYLDQPTREPQREAQGSYYPAPRRSDPPSYEPAPRTYYRAPYEDPRAR
jgi:membrane peptidoglycan carboxypeptidase